MCFISNTEVKSYSWFCDKISATRLQSKVIVYEVEVVK